MEILEWLKSIGCSIRDFEQIFSDNIEPTNKTIQVFQWLFENGAELSASVFAAAAKRGNFYILNWLKEHNCPFSNNVFFSAATAGKIDVLEWLREHGYKQNPTYVYKLNVSCQAMSIEVIEWFESHPEIYSE